jgi:hypothetical protein
MGPDKAARWKNEALDQIFAALAASRTLAGRVVFKGARILNRRLGTDDRQSLDIDMNLTEAYLAEYPTPDAQRTALQAELSIALTRYFGEQDVVRYDVVQVAVQRKPKDDHPRGWNAFEVKVRLRDLANPTVRDFPSLTLDVAAPERLGPHATAPLQVGDHEVTAYTLERIAGEKLRAYLTSLPAYRQKTKRPGEAIRAKDLYDIARIERVRPVAAPGHVGFWRAVATEFQLACESRFVDCVGLTTFAEAIEAARAVYDTDATLPRDDVDFDAAWAVIARVVGFLESEGVFPLAYPLGASATSLEAS